MKEKHSDEVINYCIDNNKTFTEAYIELIDTKLNGLSTGLKDLRHDVTMTINDNR